MSEMSIFSAEIWPSLSESSHMKIWWKLSIFFFSTILLVELVVNVLLAWACFLASASALENCFLADLARPAA